MTRDEIERSLQQALDIAREAIAIARQGCGPDLRVQAMIAESRAELALAEFQARIKEGKQMDLEHEMDREINAGIDAPDLRRRIAQLESALVAARALADAVEYRGRSTGAKGPLTARRTRREDAALAAFRATDIGGGE